MTELQTGHCHLKGHPFKLVLIKSPQWQMQAGNWSGPFTFFLTVKQDAGIWAVILWNKVTLKTSLCQKDTTLCSRCGAAAWIS
jgi:hypothetical protein